MSLDTTDYTKRFIADCASRFIGSFFALLFAGAIILMGLRMYIGWEAERIANSIQKEMKRELKGK